MKRVNILLFLFVASLITYSLIACNEDVDEFENIDNVKVINLPSGSAGTLYCYFRENDFPDIKKLRIKGLLNAEDFEFIRSNLSALEYLDLSEVEITGGRLYFGTVRVELNYYINYNYKSDVIPTKAFQGGEECYSWRANISRIEEVCFSYDLSNLKEVILPKQLIGIDANAFGNTTRIEILKLPSTNLEYIASGQKFSGLKSISVAALTPPEVSDNDFRCIPEDAILYVPKGKKALYEKAIGWNRIKNIIEK